jgi:hypothetical protein
MANAASDTSSSARFGSDITFNVVSTATSRHDEYPLNNAIASMTQQRHHATVNIILTMASHHNQCCPGSATANIASALSSPA